MKKRERHIFDILATAYHEAGHAVVGELLGVKIREVSIIPERKINSLGHTAVSYKPKLSFEHLCFCLAGALSAEYILDIPAEGWENDFMSVGIILMVWQEQRNKKLNWLQEQ